MRSGSSSGKMRPDLRTTQPLPVGLYLRALIVSGRVACDEIAVKHHLCDEPRQPFFLVIGLFIGRREGPDDHRLAAAGIAVAMRRGALKAEAVAFLEQEPLA